ncbi:hypothetical protein B4140_2400 [Bacillus amyloliquefaciens]|nr:hypothetical protein B4140_2400 [Bacillus amyloliquefaciens]
MYYFHKLYIRNCKKTLIYAFFCYNTFVPKSTKGLKFDGVLF